MKKCKQCGKENPDESMFCHECGERLENPTTNDTNPNDFNPNQQSDYNPNYSQQENSKQQYNYQQNEYQQTYNGQQNQYQPNYQFPDQKNMWIAIIANVVGGFIVYILSGIGYFYLGLYKRGLIICALGLVITLIGAGVIYLTESSFMGSLISLILALILIAYSAYDAYLCTDAINHGQAIPPLFGILDLD